VDTLTAGQQLKFTDQFESTNASVKLVMQADSNLVLYRNDTGGVLWATNTRPSTGIAFFGKVRALYAYGGDPSITPTPEPPVAELLGRGYTAEAELSVQAVEIVMDGDYLADVRSCKRIVHEIDRKHIAVNLGRAVIDPGDPPPDQRWLLERVGAAALAANATGLVLSKLPAVRS